MPICLGLTAVNLAQKLMPFLSRVEFFRALSSIWNVKVTGTLHGTDALVVQDCWNHLDESIHIGTIAD